MVCSRLMLYNVSLDSVPCAWLAFAQMVCLGAGAFLMAGALLVRRWPLAAAGALMVGLSPWGAVVLGLYAAIYALAGVMYMRRARPRPVPV